MIDSASIVHCNLAVSGEKDAEAGIFTTNNVPGYWRSTIPRTIARPTAHLKLGVVGELVVQLDVGVHLLESAVYVGQRFRRNCVCQRLGRKLLGSTSRNGETKHQLFEIMVIIN